MKNKLLIKLLFLLALVVLIGKIVIVKEQPQEEEPIIEEVDSLLVFSDNYILASSTPFYTEPSVLVTKVDKIPETTNKGQIRTLLGQCEWDTNLAWAVMMAESGGNLEAHNTEDFHKSKGCYGSYGLFQMGCLHFGSYGLTWENRFTAEANINAACQLWRERGWQPWGVFTNGSYRKFLY